MLSLDLQLTRWINALSGHTSLADLFMVMITYYGPYLMVGLIALRWFAKSNRIEERHLVIRCGFATISGLLLNQALLLLFHRVRPYELGVTRLIVEKSGDPSFPSDHATVAAAITATLFLSKAKSVYLCLGFSALLWVSRIYVGTHFFSDILGGAVTGFVGAFLVHHSYHWYGWVSDRLVRAL